MSGISSLSRKRFRANKLTFESFKPGMQVVALLIPVSLSTGQCTVSYPDRGFQHYVKSCSSLSMFQDHSRAISVQLAQMMHIEMYIIYLVHFKIERPTPTQLTGKKTNDLGSLF